MRRSRRRLANAAANAPASPHGGGQRPARRRVRTTEAAIRAHDAAALADLRAVGFDPDGPGVLRYVRARGWKIDPEVRNDGPAPVRVLLIDHDGEVVGHGWGPDPDAALLAAFADYLDHADAV